MGSASQQFFRDCQPSAHDVIIRRSARLVNRRANGPMLVIRCREISITVPDEPEGTWKTDYA
jgi:hypothetical protein